MERTDKQLIDHVRKKISSAGVYQWWLALKEEDIADLCNRLEKANKPHEDTEYQRRYPDD